MRSQIGRGELSAKLTEGYKKHIRSFISIRKNSPASSSLVRIMKNDRASVDTRSFLVGVTRLELAAPRPPVWCATTCATPRS